MSDKFEIVSYEPSLRPLWDDAVRRARQASFLFERNFMDYHHTRFVDASLIILNAHHKPLALLPACISPTDAHRIESHGGLTYGGLLLLPAATVAATGSIMQDCFNFYKSRGFQDLIYKPLPLIYHTYPAEEDLYWLFRWGATLEARAVSSVIDLRMPYPFSTLRRRKLHKAEHEAYFKLSIDEAHLSEYWQVLTQVLQTRHATHPVHSLDEMRKLMQAFPNEIKLITALHEVKGIERVVAGCVVFLTRRVVHVQYIAASDEGCQMNALDWLFHQVVTHFQSDAASRPWFDFGISTEHSGTVFNEGLIFQKEGMGGRAVCYDAYKVTL